MLGVFAKAVAPFPELDQSLNLHTPESNSAMENGLAKYYTTLMPDSFMMDFQPCCMLATGVDRRNAFVPGLFQAKDDIFCILGGSIDNIHDLAKDMGLNVKNDQPTIFIDAYRAQRRTNDGPETCFQKIQREYHWINLIRSIRGKFVIIIFDNLKKTMFAATDRDAHIPLYWGIDLVGDLVLSSSHELIQLACHRASGRFPQGCYISTSDGLKTLDDREKELQVEEAVDSEGNFCLKVTGNVAANTNEFEGSTESTARN